MNGLVYAGFGIVVVAVVFAIIWLKQGSKDKTATEDDIKELSNVLGVKIDESSTRIETAINNLADEIRGDKENRSNNKGTKE